MGLTLKAIQSIDFVFFFNSETLTLKVFFFHKKFYSMIFENGRLLWNL